MNVTYSYTGAGHPTHVLTWKETEEEVACYFSDLGLVPRFLPDEAERLVTCLQQADRGELPESERDAARRRLVEGNLDLVVVMARKYRSSFRHFSLADLIQEGNIALIEASLAFVRAKEMLDFRSYAAGAIKHAYLKALARDRDVHITEYQYHHNPASRHQYAVSLDQLHGDDDGYCLYDLLAEQTPQEVDDTEARATKRQQVEQLLASLTEQQQEVLQRKYGLSEQDGRMQQQREIAEALGTTCSSVRSMAHDAVERLRLDPEEARRRVRRGANFQRNRSGVREIDEQDRAQLLCAYERMQARGQALNVRTIAKEAKVDGQIAIQFLHEQIGLPEERLEGAYVTLLKEGGPITLKRLARAAHCSDRAARSFLLARGALLPQGHKAHCLDLRSS